MSRKEIYAWCSFGLTLAILGYYLISVFGLPTGIEKYGEQISSLIWRVIAVTFVIQLVIGVLDSTKLGGVSEDERDQLIELKAFRNAYYFLMISVVSLIINVLISDLLRETTGEKLFLAIPFMTFHALVVVLFISSLIKYSTQIFYYQRGI